MEPADLGQHISRRFNEDMERVRTRVLQMGGFVEEQLRLAVKALVEGDSELGEQIARDDYKVNRMEVEIDEECGRIIATRQPTASDLRVMVAIIKTITDLERIGDDVEKVGFIAAKLASMEKPADHYREIRHLGRLVIGLVHDALHAFARLDADEAFEVARSDRKVDEEYEAIQRQNITFMMEDPRSIRRALEVMISARGRASCPATRHYGRWPPARTRSRLADAGIPSRSAASGSSDRYGSAPWPPPWPHTIC
jgi:phosphate transport system protein